MAQTLWDTTGAEVLQALLEERRTAGALAAGLALTLVVVVDEKRVREAELAATAAAAAHPCRLLIVVRRKIESDNRLDAEVQVGGRLGPTEAVVMRMWGRLALHAESVVLPLLAPDAPVVTWWHGPPPEDMSTDALGVLANRRITDSAQAEDPIAALHTRARDFVPGDTDLAWTRTTPFRAVLAGAIDSVPFKPRSGAVTAPAGNPSGALLRGWLSARLGVEVGASETSGTRIEGVRLDGTVDEDEYAVEVTGRDDATAVLRRDDESERQLPLARRELGDLIAEELRRMEPDLVYAEALAAATGVEVDERLRARTHRWLDPAWQQGGESDPAGGGAGGGGEGDPAGGATADPGTGSSPGGDAAAVRS